MCSSPASEVVNRTICFIFNALLLGSLTACYAKVVKTDGSTGNKTVAAVSPRSAAPIPVPTSVLPFLPPPGAVAKPVGGISKANQARQYKSRLLPAQRDSGDASRVGVGVNNGVYSVVVQKAAASDVLFALAQDSALGLDIVGEVKGNITLNAVDQTLDRILEKIARQVAISYEITSHSLVVVADTPQIRTYQVDHLNISRSTQSRVELATQVGSLKTTLDSAQNSVAGNGSQMSIENRSDNQFWNTLVENIAGIINDDASPALAGAPAATNQKSSSNLFVNRESGIIAVRATTKQHRIIKQFIGEVVGSSKRQVLIEATVVEVTLSDTFESGIDWRILDTNGGAALDYAQILSGTTTAANATAPETGLLSYRNAGSSMGDISATLKMLRQFGDVQVLSSPKIIALNNQPAVLKVVDNRIYFTFEVDRQETENGDSHTVVDSTVHSVPIGLVMSVTPFINHLDEVILNVRPTISRILNFAEDPSPALAGQTQVKNLIPEIQVREMESVLRVQSGDVAIIGGLMQNKVDNRSSGLPGFGQLPILGKIFSRDSKKLEKTELLVFLRPTVMKRSDFQRNGDQLLRFVPYREDQLLMGGEESGTTR